MREWHLMTAHAVHIPKYDQMRAESRLPSSSDDPVLLINKPIDNKAATFNTDLSTSSVT